MMRAEEKCDKVRAQEETLSGAEGNVGEKSCFLAYVTQALTIL